MKRFRPSSTLIVFSIVVFLFWASLYVYVPILPVHAAALEGGSLGLAGLVVSMYGLTQFILRIPLGVFSDRLNARKSLIYLGFALSGLSALGLAFTRTVGGAAAFRGLGGAAASTWVIIITLFAGLFPQNAAVRATSLAVFLSVSGQMTASLTGGAVAQRFGSQAAFLTAAGLTLIGLLILPFLKQETAASHPDYTAEKGTFKIGWYLILVSAAAAVVQFIAYATIYGYLPILADQMGANSAQLGSFTATSQFAYTLTSLLLTFALHGRREKAAALTGIAVMGAAAFQVLIIRQIDLFYLTSALLGIGQGLSYPVLMGLAIKPVQSNRRATAMGIFQAIYALGMFAGPAASGWISEQAGLPAVFSSCGWLALISLPVLFFGLKTTTRNPASQPALQADNHATKEG